MSTGRWKVKSLAKEVYLGRLGVEGNYIMVPCQSCNIYGTWSSKEVAEGFKVIIWVGESHKARDHLLWGELNPLDTMG